jgi:hypothetical protein
MIRVDPVVRELARWVVLALLMAAAVVATTGGTEAEGCDSRAPVVSAHGAEPAAALYVQHVTRVGNHRDCR